MKNFSLSILFLFITSFAVAQEGLKIGIRFSPIISFASITDEDNNDIPGLETGSTLGLSYGIILNYGFTENYSFHTGLHIVNKGFDRSSTGDSIPSIQDVRITTVEIPIALKARSNEVSNGIYISGKFGGSIDIGTGYKNEYSGIDPKTGLAVTTPGVTKDTKLINPLTLSFLFGLGVDWEIDRVGMVNIGLTYHQGLSNINRQKGFSEAATGSNEKIKINYLSIDLAYFF